MAHTVGADKNNQGKFAYTVFNQDGDVERGGNYPTAESARLAAENGNRALMASNWKHKGPVLENDYMELDDILEFI